MEFAIKSGPNKNQLDKKVKGQNNFKHNVVDHPRDSILIQIFNLVFDRGNSPLTTSKIMQNAVTPVTNNPFNSIKMPLHILTGIIHSKH